MEFCDDLFFRDRDEAEEYHQATVGADFDMIKFDPGDINLGMTWVALADLLIVWARADGKARWLAQHSNDLPCFFFAFECEHLFWGRELGKAHAVFGRARGIREGSFPSGCTTLDITLSKDLMNRLGWTVGEDIVLETDPDALNDLRVVCRLATRRGWELLENGNDWPEGEPERWQGRILDALERAAMTCLNGDTDTTSTDGWMPSHHQQVLATEKVLRDHVQHGTIAVSDLAQRLGVSERAIYHGFRRSFGHGPRQHLELLRLNELRKRLKSADPEFEGVLDIADSLGFSEFGRMAGAYRRQFGELPSDTLRGK